MRIGGGDLLDAENISGNAVMGLNMPKETTLMIVSRASAETARGFTHTVAHRR